VGRYSFNGIYDSPDHFTSDPQDFKPQKPSGQIISNMKSSIGRMTKTMGTRSKQVIDSLSPISLFEDKRDTSEENKQLNTRFEALLIKLGVQLIVRNTLLKSLNRVEKYRAVTLSTSLINDNKNFCKDDADVLSSLLAERTPDSLLILILKARISVCCDYTTWIKSFCASRGMLSSAYKNYKSYLSYMNMKKYLRYI
jgi:hypothetical protein